MTVAAKMLNGRAVICHGHRPQASVMSPYSIVVVLVVAMVLLAIGLNASDSLAGQLNATFTGRLTKAATWYAVGGIAAGPRVTHGRVWWASAKIGQVTVDTPLIDCRHGGGF